MSSDRTEVLQMIEEEFLNNSEYLKLKQELEAKKAKEQAEAMSVVTKLINMFDLDISKLCKNPEGKVRNVAPPKYKNTVTGQTWTGRGRQPKSYLENPEQWIEL